MNKRTNPFYPPPASAASHPPYVPTAQQPPASGGGGGGGAQGYSQYWSQNGQYQQPTQSQWSSPAAPATPASAPPAPHATPEHANLYANYGYGGSHSLAWNNQAHSQPQSAPPAAPGPPATNQHQAIPIPYSSPYAPPQPAHPATPQHAVHQHPQSAYASSPTPQYHPSHPSPISHYNRQAPPPPMHQPPPPHMPPLKRPRYDPPPQHQPLPQRFAPPPAPPHRGPMHGGPPPAPMGPPPPQVSANMTPLGPRSGPGSTFVNGNYGGRGGARPPPMRGGGPMGPGPMNRGPMRGRGGGPMVNSRAMGGQANQLRSGGARAQSGVQRRQAQRGGVGNAQQRNASGSVLASGKASLPNHPGVSSARSSGAVSSAATAASAKRDDTRRTFTDFKIIGLELRGAEWRWGQKREPPAATVPEDAVSADASAPATADATLPVASVASAETPVASTAGPEQSVATQNGAAPPSVSSTSNLAACRIRIYFHNPKLEGVNGSSPLKLAGDSPLPRASKRKKADDDDDSVELESEQRARRPLPPHVSAQFEEASVVDGASVTGTEDAEEDWLMAVMADGSQDVASIAPGAAPTNGHAVAATTGVVTAMDTHSEGSHGQAASDWSEVVADPAATNDGAAEASGSATISNDEHADGIEVESSAISNEHDVSASTAIGTSPAAGEPSATAQEHAEDEPMTPPAEERDPYQELMSPGSVVASVDAAVLDDPAQETELELEHEHESEQTDEHVAIELADESSVGWNRLSIAYDGGSRRLIVASVAVKKLTIFRAEGRIEIDLVVTQRDEQQIEGIILESLVDRASQEHQPVSMSTDATTSDLLVPPFMTIATSTQEVTLVAYLDLDKPLSSAKWVKSNDLQEWLRMTAGKQAAVKTPDSWIGRIVVSDPDPPPNIHTVLDAWTHASNIGALPDRKTFVADHLTNNISNILEVLLRMVRSDRAQAFTPAAVSQSAVHDQLGSNPLAEAMTLGSPLAKHQTHVSLAVLAMYKMLDDQAKKAGPEATALLATQIGELVRCLPQNQVYKSLDMMFKDVIHYKPKPKSGKA